MTVNMIMKYECEKIQLSLRIPQISDEMFAYYDGTLNLNSVLKPKR